MIDFVVHTGPPACFLFIKILQLRWQRLIKCQIQYLFLTILTARLGKGSNKTHSGMAYTSTRQYKPLRLPKHHSLLKIKNNTQWPTKSDNSVWSWLFNWLKLRSAINETAWQGYCIIKAQTPAHPSSSPRLPVNRHLWLSSCPVFIVQDTCPDILCPSQWASNPPYQLYRFLEESGTIPSLYLTTEIVRAI